MELENKLKVFEANSVLQCDNEYLDCKERLDNLYQEQINGIRIRSRCDWYEYGEKSSKFFLNLEKSRAVQGQIRYLLSGDNELTNKKEINNHLYMFYKSLFTENKKLSETQITYFLDEISNFPKLTSKQSNDCETPLSEKELFDALKGMPDNKSPGNDSLTKEFYERFWSDVKIPFFENVLFSFDIGELSISQRQSMIKLIEKNIGTKG